jgi:hypothetical protein
MKMRFAKKIFIALVLLISIGANANAENILKTCPWGALASEGYFEFKECHKYNSANDDYGLKQMLKSGKCFMIEPGIKILLLESSGYGYGYPWQFRVLEGRYKNKAVWLDGSIIKFYESKKAKKEKQKTK